MKERVQTVFTAIVSALVDGLVILQKWFDHQNGYDHTPLVMPTQEQVASALYKASYGNGWESVGPDTRDYMRYANVVMRLLPKRSGMS